MVFDTPYFENEPFFSLLFGKKWSLPNYCMARFKKGLFVGNILFFYAYICVKVAWLTYGCRSFAVAKYL